MTAHTKSNIKLFIPYLAFLPAFYMIFAWGEFKANSESKMFDTPAQKEHTVAHKEKGTDAYSNVHMDLKEKDARYVNNDEFDSVKSDIAEIKSANLTIQNDVKELLKRK